MNQETGANTWIWLASVPAGPFAGDGPGAEGASAGAAAFVLAGAGGGGNLRIGLTTGVVKAGVAVRGRVGGLGGGGSAICFGIAVAGVFGTGSVVAFGAASAAVFGTVESGLSGWCTATCSEKVTRLDPSRVVEPSPFVTATRAVSAGLGSGSCLGCLLGSSNQTKKQTSSSSSSSDPNSGRSSTASQPKISVRRYS